MPPAACLPISAMVQRVQHGPAALIPLQLFRLLFSDYLSRQEHPAVEHGQFSPVFSAGKQLHAGTVTPSLLEAAGGRRGRLRTNMDAGADSLLVAHRHQTLSS